MPTKDQVDVQFNKSCDRPLGLGHRLVVQIVGSRGKVMVGDNDLRRVVRHIGECLLAEFKLPSMNPPVADRRSGSRRIETNEDGVV